MKKIVTQNLSITIFSKLLAFISFIYIAKVLSTDEYGAFVYITMILSLLPMLQFGSMHGTTILLPKYLSHKDGSEENLFWTYNTISHLIQFFSLFFMVLFDIDVSILILLVIAINYFLSKYSENIQILLSAKLEFEKMNVIKVIDQIARPLMTLGLFIIYKNIESIFISQLVVTIATFLISNYFVQFKTISSDFYNFKNIIGKIYTIGFFVYMIWVIDILFRTVDRWFISQFYSLEELATYGFTSSLAMNIWLLAMSFFAPYSQLLYKYVAENNYLEVKKIVEQTNKKLYLLLSLISIFAIAFYPFVLEYFIHKYFDTEFLFAVLVLTSVFLAINNMYIYYMISNNLHFILLKYQAIILGLNIFLNAIFAYFHLSIIYFSYSTIVTLVLYFILVKRYFLIDIEKKLEIKPV